MEKGGVYLCLEFLCISDCEGIMQVFQHLHNCTQNGTIGAILYRSRKAEPGQARPFTSFARKGVCPNKKNILME